MKKSTKIILLTATGLVAFGIVLTVAGVIAGASFKEIYHGGLWNHVYYEEEYDNSFKSSGVYEVDSENIDKISIDWVSGDIDIVPYDGDNIVMKETARKEITDKGRSQIDDFIDDWHEIEAVYEYIKEGKGRE